MVNLDWLFGRSEDTITAETNTEQGDCKSCADTRYEQCACQNDAEVNTKDCTFCNGAGHVPCVMCCDSSGYPLK